MPRSTGDKVSLNDEMMKMMPIIFSGCVIFLEYESLTEMKTILKTVEHPGMEHRNY